ncbi:hypothetical protein [Flavobacterium undicola]|uniref:hypothetical protein n=1 Tax=Flavobacterium undicola TaxID=1932779 RepID=UPI0013770ECC|nr:hypothetical protein [Flavobacterium undicola]MBA0882404.1 hypothetical protein [Flavobacterium undicola]
MKKNLILIIGFCCFTMMSFTMNAIIDYLSTGSELSFNNEKYDLAWSSHPNATYFKQEYLRKSDKLEKYEKMILVEAIKTTLNPEKASQMKINELDNIKKVNPIVNFKQVQVSNQNDKIISFTISGGNILEWNVYRYQQQQIENENMIILYAYSYRNYVSTKEDVTKFMNYVKNNENKMIETITKTNIPKVKIK